MVLLVSFKAAVPTNVLVTKRSKFNPIPRTANLVPSWSSIMLAGFMRVEVIKMFVAIFVLFYFIFPSVQTLCTNEYLSFFFIRFGIN